MCQKRLQNLEPIQGMILSGAIAFSIYCLVKLNYSVEHYEEVLKRAQEKDLVSKANRVVANLNDIK